MDSILGADRIVPVLAFHAVEEALAVCGVLLESGLRVLEITLRTPAALACIEAVAAAYPAACVGVGTVLDGAQVEAARAAGARFGVSPGLSPGLLRALSGSDWPFLPGVATASEVLAAREHGFRLLKFFPAEAGGGLGFLRALQDVVPDVAFCATGGIGPANAAAYLAARNLRAIGGSWMVRRGEDGRIDLEATRIAARECAALARS